MTARVLIVDDIPTNVKLLQARLAAEYFETVGVGSGQEALDACAKGDIDIVLLDVMMPGMDGFEVCRRLKSNPQTMHVPIVMVTALDQISDKVKGLEAGADDFLNKPVDDTQLLARVKSLVRLKILTDELRLRAQTGQQIAIEDAQRATESIDTQNGKILLVDSDRSHAARICAHLEAEHRVDVSADPANVVLEAGEADYDVILVSMALGEYDPLRVCSQLRTLDRTRLVPIILLAEESDRPRVVRALDMGVNDFIMRPVERHELLARVRTQIKRQRYAAELRESLNNTLQMAVVDDLTGLYNRRYFERHFSMMFSKSIEQERSLAVMMLDLDFFKQVNDRFGHDAGDTVIKEFSNRLQRNIRGVDLACRYGGEEFVVIMPDTDMEHAASVAERVRASVADRAFDVGHDGGLSMTVSVGLATIDLRADTQERLLKRADVALYAAKRDGRNRVVGEAA